jgi:hypothetical protein
MDFPLYTDVVLICDVPEENLKVGDIGVVVDRHDVPELEPGYSVEFFDMLGNTVALVTLPGSRFRIPTQADRPSVRINSTSA